MIPTHPMPPPRIRLERLSVALMLRFLESGTLGLSAENIALAFEHLSVTSFARGDLSTYRYSRRLARKYAGALRSGLIRPRRSPVRNPV